MTTTVVAQLPWATPRLALGAGLLAAAHPQLFGVLQGSFAPVHTRQRLRPFPPRETDPFVSTLFPEEAPSRERTFRPAQGKPHSEAHRPPESSARHEPPDLPDTLTLAGGLPRAAT